MAKVVCLVALVSFLILGVKLDVTPVHLNQDELQFALNGYSIAKTGLSEYGQRLPFYFLHLDSFWATPIISYVCSLLFLFLPIGEVTARLATVLVASVSIGLVTILACKIFKSKVYGVAAGAIMLTTPAFFIHSRLLLDNIYPVLFVLLWLLFLQSYLVNKSLRHLFLSGLFLGLGLHSYHAAKIMMPLYFALTAWILKAGGVLRKLSVFLFGFLVFIILFIPWLIKYPDTLLNQVSYVSAIDTTIDAKDGYLAVFQPERVAVFLKSFATYLSPRVLFVEGDRSLIHSTGLVGVFLFPTIFLISFGAMEVWKKKDHFGKLIVAGFLTYPMAASLIQDPQRISRGLVVIPFGVLLGVYGIKFLVEQKDKVFRYLLVFIFIVMGFQFFDFFTDYFGNYRQRSAHYFNYDVGGAMESVLASTKIRKVDRIYLEKNIPFSTKYFKFYSLKKNILFENVSVFDQIKSPFSVLPANSIVIIRPEEVGSRESNIGSFEKIETIREPDGRESYWLFYR